VFHFSFSFVGNNGFRGISRNNSFDCAAAYLIGLFFASRLRGGGGARRGEGARGLETYKIAVNKIVKWLIFTITPPNSYITAKPFLLIREKILKSA